MVPPYPTYLLHVSWTWDHTNREFATLTVEGCEGSQYETGFEVLADPNGNQDDKNNKLNELRGVARALRRHQGGTLDAQLICLYRIVDQSEHSAPLGSPYALVSELHYKLQPICTFDDRGNPIPFVPASPQTTGGE